MPELRSEEEPAPFMSQEDVDDLLRTRTGTKLDGGKPRFDLIPAGVLMQIAEVFSFGAAKYTPRNWEKGLAYGRVYAAAQRHLQAYWGGETNDPETGSQHLVHAIVNLMFLVEYERTHPEMDDR